MLLGFNLQLLQMLLLQFFLHSLGCVDHQELPIILIQGTVQFMLTGRHRSIAHCYFISDLCNLLERYTLEILIHSEVAFLNIPEEFLCVRPRLRARSSCYVLLDQLPVLSEQFERLQESEVLGERPPPVPGRALLNLRFLLVGPPQAYGRGGGG